MVDRLNEGSLKSFLFQFHCIIAQPLTNLPEESLGILIASRRQTRAFTKSEFIQDSELVLDCSPYVDQPTVA